MPASLARLLSAPLLAATILAMALAVPRDAGADHVQDPPNDCNPTAVYGFARWQYSLWNFCAVDGYGPTEWMYWNYMPGTPGYDNPGAAGAPYLSLIGQAVSDWAAQMTAYKITYKSGDWGQGTDLFIKSENLDLPCGTFCRGAMIKYNCATSISCSGVTAGVGPTYNLMFLTLDTAGVTRAVVGHEFGHAFGLIDVGGSCVFPYTIMAPTCSLSAPNLTSPNLDDVVAVLNGYPE